jgi:hypothetical protein
VDLRLEDFMTFRLLLNDPMVKCFNDSIETDWRKHSRDGAETEEPSRTPQESELEGKKTKLSKCNQEDEWRLVKKLGLEEREARRPPVNVMASLPRM